MKQLFFIFIGLLSFSATAQDSIKVKVETPKIVSKLHFGKVFQYEDVELKFVKVVTDSRCPKNVSCVWAGEITVLVDVLKKGTFIEQKTLSFNPTSHLNNELLQVVSSKTYKIQGFNVMPYPVYGTKIKDEDYFIQLNITD